MFRILSLQTLLGLCTITFSIGCGSSTSSSDIKYVAIGASDATGIGASPITRGYAFQIEEQLDQMCGDTELINLGIPGAEADEIQNVAPPVADEVNPELITVWVGNNDLVGGRTVESFESDLRSILQSLRAETSAAIFVGNISDLTLLPTFQEEPDSDVTRERVEMYNAAISRQTSAINATLVNLFAADFQSEFVSDDGFHPNNEGHQAVANEFLARILPQVCQNSAN